MYDCFPPLLIKEDIRSFQAQEHMLLLVLGCEVVLDDLRVAFLTEGIREPARQSARYAVGVMRYARSTARVPTFP